MKKKIEKREPQGMADYFALAVTTVGVGYLPLMPGTYGSVVGVLVYIGFSGIDANWEGGWSASNGVGRAEAQAISIAVVLILFLIFTLIGVWASSRSTALLGDLDPPQAVVDEVMGQLITFLFVPFGISWPLVITGFLLFRLFDIWKPYPIDSLQNLPAGLGVCADDILAGVYAGVCLSVIYAFSLFL